MNLTAEEIAQMGRVESQNSTISLAPNKYVRVIAPGIDISAKLTPEQVSELIAFTLKLVSVAPSYNGPG